MMRPIWVWELDELQKEVEIEIVRREEYLKIILNRKNSSCYTYEAYYEKVQHRFDTILRLEKERRERRENASGCL
jgi:hypothetical protein